MKLALMAPMMALGCFVMTGCETLSQTPGENFARVYHAVDTDLKQVPDDVERLLLIDHPILLSEKPVPRY